MGDRDENTSLHGQEPLLDGWLTRAEVAAELGVSEDSLQRWEVRRIGPPCARIGRKVFYRAKAFREWLLSHETPAFSKGSRAGGGR